MNKTHEKKQMNTDRWSETERRRWIDGQIVNWDRPSGAGTVVQGGRQNEWRGI
jgi:hypothetical protein